MGKSKATTSSSASNPNTLRNSSPNPNNPFGNPLAKQPTCTSRTGIPNVPVFLNEALNFLEDNGLQLEGLFRISGSSGSIQKLKSAFESGERTQFQKGDDPYDVACLVKLFFRELPDSLLTFELYDCFIAAQGFPDDYVIGAIAKVIDMLPPPSLTCLMCLMEFNLKVIQYETVNKMGASNLSIVFAPNILRPKEETIEIIVGDSQRSYNTLLAMMDNFDAMFKKHKDKIESQNAQRANEEAEKLRQELAKKYADHKQEIEEQLSNEFSARTTQGEGEEFEKQIAETVANIKLGVIDDSVTANEETWDAKEYKQHYNRTLRGMKSASFTATKERKEPSQQSNGVSTQHGWIPAKRADQTQKKAFTLNTNPAALSKMYFGNKK